jgi:hypothetical protein
MLRPAHFLARWLKLVLACTALAALSPAPAVASAAAVVEPVSLVEGGPAEAPAAGRRSIRFDRYSPPPAAAHERENSQVAREALRLGPTCVRERLFLLHRALLR